MVVSKLYRNLNLICKLSIKELKELVKVEPEYQEVLGELYFDKRINNYIRLREQEHPTTITGMPIQEERPGNRVVDIQWRIEFTISTIAKKNVMKPVVMLVFVLNSG